LSNTTLFSNGRKVLCSGGLNHVHHCVHHVHPELTTRRPKPSPNKRTTAGCSCSRSGGNVVKPLRHSIYGAAYAAINRASFGYCSENNKVVNQIKQIEADHGRIKYITNTVGVSQKCFAKPRTIRTLFDFKILLLPSSMRYS
jgi:hypothetical protein